MKKSLVLTVLSLFVFLSCDDNANKSKIDAQVKKNEPLYLRHKSEDILFSIGNFDIETAMNNVAAQKEVLAQLLEKVNKSENVTLRTNQFTRVGYTFDKWDKCLYNI